MTNMIGAADRARAARAYRRLGLPIGARAVLAGKLDDTPAVQEAARLRMEEAAMV